MLCIGGLVVVGYRLSRGGAPGAPAAGGFPPAHVTISRSLQRSIASRTGFLGRFSAVNALETRAQVGGTPTGIRFNDGADRSSGGSVVLG